MSNQPCGPLTDTVVMVAPAQFGFNPETAQTNTFQMGHAGEHDTPEQLREAACSEFQQMVEILKSHQIRELLLRGREEELPDLYSTADVTVIPSYRESFGLAAVESLACGTPVVAARASVLQYSWQNVTGLMREVYEDVLSETAENAALPV